MLYLIRKSFGLEILLAFLWFQHRVAFLPFNATSLVKCCRMKLFNVAMDLNVAFIWNSIDT